MAISEEIHSVFHLPIIKGNHKDDTTYIGHILFIIDDN